MGLFFEMKRSEVVTVNSDRHKKYYMFIPSLNNCISESTTRLSYNMTASDLTNVLIKIFCRETVFSWRSSYLELRPDFYLRVLLNNQVDNKAATTVEREHSRTNGIPK